MRRFALIPAGALIVAALACTLTGPTAVITTTPDATLGAMGTALAVQLTASRPTTSLTHAAPTAFPAQSPLPATPEPRPTSPPGALPPEAILILDPGSGSSITSPVRVSGEADPTFEQSLVVQITDAEGAVVATVPVQIAAEAGQRGPFSVDVSFSVSANQPGRVSVFSASARDGGLIHLASAEVTLLASGVASLTTSQSHLESIALSEPQFLATVSGGTAHLTGFSDYVFENQLGVVICGEWRGRGARDRDGHAQKHRDRREL